MAFQSTKFLSLLDLQSFCANCPTATVQAVRIRDLEKEVAVLKAENLQLKADNAQMRRLWRSTNLCWMNPEKRPFGKRPTNHPPRGPWLRRRREWPKSERIGGRGRKRRRQRSRNRARLRKIHCEISNAGDNVNAPKAARLGIRGMECRYPGMRRHSLSGIFQSSAWVVHSVKAAFPL